MALLKPGRPAITRTPTILVENDLVSGRYRFRLRVFDEEGNVSSVDEQVVVIGRSIGPAIDMDSDDRIRLPRRLG